MHPYRIGRSTAHRAPWFVEGTPALLVVGFNCAPRVLARICLSRCSAGTVCGLGAQSSAIIVRQSGVETVRLACVDDRANGQVELLSLAAFGRIEGVVDGAGEELVAGW